jgi:hypothetical protein
LRQILKNPKHPEHAAMPNWLGGAYDPEQFDIDAVNRVLSVLCA